MHFSSPHPYKMNKELFLIQLFINLLSDLGSLSETSRKVEKKSELIGRGGFYRRPVIVTGCRWKKNFYHKFPNALDGRLDDI